MTSSISLLRKTFFLWMIVASSVFLSYHVAQGFCIYNNMDANTQVNIRVSTLGDEFTIFAKVLNPGDVECCNWSDDGCNLLGYQYSLVQFLVQFTFDNGDLSDPYNAKCLAGGALSFYGSEHNYLTCATCTSPDESTTSSAILLPCTSPCYDNNAH